MKQHILGKLRRGDRSSLNDNFLVSVISLKSMGLGAAPAILMHSCAGQIPQDNQITS